MTAFRTTASAVAIMAASPAFADLSAEDVWAHMSKAATEVGMTVSTGGESRAGDTLTLTNVRYAIAVPEMTMAIHIDEIVLQELGDGRVSLVSTDVPLAMNFDVDGEKIDVLARILLPDGETILSGDPDAVSSSFVYPSATLTLDGIIVNDTPADVSFNLNIADFVGTTLVTAPEQEGGLMNQEADYSTGPITFEGAFEIPEEDPGLVTLSGSIDGLTTSGSGTVAPAMGMSAGLPDGFWAKSTASRGALAFNMIVEGDDGNMSFGITDGGGAVNVDIADGVIGYAGSNNNTQITVAGTILPMPPVEIGIGNFGGSILLPLTPSEEERDFGFGLRMEGLEVSELLWSMLDPFGGLPHDPADLIMEFSGTGKLMVDLFDPNFNPETMTAAPGELSSVRVDEFAIRAVGAEITASGEAVNVEENPLAPPRMVGALDVSAAGIQGLMQKLGQMGLLPADQAGMANMMLGIFAVPGSEPDTFTSRIEMLEDGSILANGQQLQ